MVRTVLTTNNSAYLAQFVSNGILKLVSDKKLLLDADLKNLYNLGEPEIQKIAAHALSDRGDDTLALHFIGTESPKFKSSYASVRMEALREIGSIGKYKSLPYVLDSLKDADPNTKLQALALMGAYGSNRNITAVEALLSDKNLQVKLQAQLTIEDLWYKNTPGLVTQEQHFAPPGNYDENVVVEINQNEDTATTITQENNNSKI